MRQFVTFSAISLLFIISYLYKYYQANKMNIAKNNLKISSVLTALLLAYSASSLACSSCGCTLNSDWSAQGYSSGEGTRLDIRFDYFKQDEYRHGTNKINRSDIPSDTEVQNSTFNRNLSIGLDHSFNHEWGVNLLVPVFNRTHSTYGVGFYPALDGYDTSSSSGIGDVRVTGRYQGFSDDHSTGITFGLKLPTGETNDTFKSGDALDRGLELGTGTTDLLLGGYHFGNINRDWDYFAQATVQIPLNSHHDFRPGNGLNVTTGVRYAGFETFIPQLQFNARVEKRESGAEADIPNSGATLVYLSPGVTVPVNKQIQAFGFFQVPVYQRVNGYQLEPKVTVSAGLRYNF